MTPSYPLCVFLESREQQKLSVHHPFYCLIHETLQNFIQLECPVILQYMARDTLGDEKLFDTAVETKRVHDIIHYLQDTCPTVSGSDSPAMDSTFVVMRAYSGCGKDPKSRKIVRKHVYIQKRLVDAWMKVYSDTNRLSRFRLLTFFVQLCLLRGLTAAVKTAFVAEGVNNANLAGSALFGNSPSPCSFKHFISQWSNGCLVFGRRARLNINKPHKDVPYDDLQSIIFSDRSCYLDMSLTCAGSQYLQQLMAGDWNATFTPRILSGRCHTCNDIGQNCLQMWDSPPTGDPKFRRIETTPHQAATTGYLERMYYRVWQQAE